MNTKNISKHYSLVRIIFLSLLGVAAATVMLFVFFRMQHQITQYKSEVRLLKKSFSENQKLEIKNKILQIKDYIEWIKNIPLEPISRTLSSQAERLEIPTQLARDSLGRYSKVITTELKDSIQRLWVPVRILDKNGKSVYSFDPLDNSANKDPDSVLIKILQQVQASTGNKGIVTAYKSDGTSDSKLDAVAYYNRDLLPGYSVVSLVASDHFEDILKLFTLDSISRLRYTENEYVFVNTLSGQALVTHGKLNRPPVDILSSGDTNWIKVFKVQQTAAVNPDGVFHIYPFKKLSSSDISSKTSLFSYIPEWKWIIGTGFYEDDINSVIELKKKELFAELRGNIFNTLAFLLLSALVCYLLVSFFSKRIRRNIDLFRNFFDKAASDNHFIDNSQVHYKEFAYMAEAANEMVGKRIMAQQALFESEAKYRYLFEQNPAPMLIYELGSLKMLKVNVAFINHYGYTQEDVEAMILTDLFPENEKDAIIDLSHKISGYAYAGEWHHIKKDGTMIITETHSHEINFEGMQARIAVIGDVTERKNAEEKVRNINLDLEKIVEHRTLQLETSNKELESFSYSISHDLRAPLRAIYGFSQILSSRHRPSLNEEGRQYMDYIVEASIRMEHLINDLLNYSRLGRKTLELHPVSLNDVLNNIHQDFKQQLTQTGGQLIISPDLPRISGDESLLNQVFTNLIGNAITYRRENIPLVIDITSENLSLFPVVKITDNGIGIPKEHWEKIFNVFQRLHTEDRYPGTGIGLATVKKAISLLGGRIWVESVIGEGSTFFIKFNGQNE